MIGGKIYVSGGVTTLRQRQKSLYVYDPSTNIWTRKRDMPHFAWRGVTGVIGDKLYVLPGCDETVSAADCHTAGPWPFYRYDPRTDQWTTLPQPPELHIDAIAGVIGGKFYVAAGDGLGTRLDVFDPVTNAWTTKKALPRQRAWSAGAAVGGKLYVVGGINGSSNTSLGTTLVYDPKTDTWAIPTREPSPRIFVAASRVVRDGVARLELVGGLRPGNNLEYTP